jgi:hypothetical protein
MGRQIPVVQSRERVASTRAKQRKLSVAGEPANSKEMERFPAVSPDRKHPFFTRATPGYGEGVFWVSARIIETLKAKAIREHHLKPR